MSNISKELLDRIPKELLNSKYMSQAMLEYLEQLKDPNSEASKNARKAYNMMNEEPEEE